MCVLVIAWKADRRWPLVVVTNRDEFHVRPAAPLHHWQDKNILAGRDLQSGGTWLGLSTGVIAAVTNAGPMPVPPLISRGKLVIESLFADSSGRDLDEFRQFNPFNLLTVTSASAYFVTNCPKPARTELFSGFHKFGNGSLNERFRRGAALECAVAEWLMTSGDRAESLLVPLSPGFVDKQDGNSRGADRCSEDETSEPIFILDPVYGTRCSTVIAVDAAGQGKIIERSFAASGSITQEHCMEFDWSAF